MPLFALSGLNVPLPEIVQRAAASLLPGVGLEPSQRPAVHGSIRLVPDDGMVARATAAGPVPAPMLFGRTAPRAGVERRTAPAPPRKRKLGRTGSSSESVRAAKPREVPAPRKARSAAIAVATGASEPLAEATESQPPAAPSHIAADEGSQASAGSSGGSHSAPRSGVPVSTPNGSSGSGSETAGGGPGSNGDPVSSVKNEKDTNVVAEVAVPGVGGVSAGVSSGSGNSGNGSGHGDSGSGSSG